ncbi:MAG: flagellar motor protein MotB [Desulfobacteraceae bacterium]
MEPKPENQSGAFDPFNEDVFSCPFELKRERWSVPWSDLMMTMFIFFVVMYVYQTGNRKLEFGSGPGNSQISQAGTDSIVNANVKSQPSDIYDRTKAAFQDTFVDNTTTVDLVEDKSVRISLAGDLLFDTGIAALKPEAMWSLDQVAKIIRENGFIVNVVGHTDATPTYSKRYPTNWELSTARACNVARYLIEKWEIPGSRFFVSGHAWHQPVLPNNTPQRRSLNRRVEIVLMKNKPYSDKETSFK